MAQKLDMEPLMQSCMSLFESFINDTEHICRVDG
jgi:hypothetical protein